MTITYHTKTQTIIEITVDPATNGINFENGKAVFTDKKTGKWYRVPVQRIIQITD